EVLNSTPLEKQGVSLTVYSNEPVMVYVKHTESGPETPRTPLGPTPLHEKPGAHLEDVVILENEIRGIDYEDSETLRYGQPGDIKQINKEFQKGWLRPVISPKSTSGLAFYRGKYLVGKYIPGGGKGSDIEMVEGDYDLELRGPKLTLPVP